MTDVVKRILNLIDGSGLNDNLILKELEISNSSTITDWRKEKSKNPSVDNIIKFASYFKVSTDYLLTGFNTENILSPNKIEITKKEAELIENYRILSNNEQEEIFEIIKLKLRIAKKITPPKSFDSTNSSTNDKIG